jgi:hypothetical protein
MNENRIEKLALSETAIGSLVAGGAVFAAVVWLLIVCCSLAVVPPAFAQSGAAGVRLEAGIAKEEVNGDLKSAIDIYQKIAADPAAPRDVRAKAMLRLAGCYEKLGQQARRVYEQILHDYADQPSASQARTRLAALKQQEHPFAPAAMTTRKIELSEDIAHVGASDTNGRLVFYNYNTQDGDLYIGDLASHQKRLLIKAGSGKASLALRPSRDFTLETVGSISPPTIAVIRADGSGYRELMRDDQQGTMLGHRGFDLAWSWDARYLLVWGGHGARLWLVSVSDGQRREVVSLKDGYIRKAAFSADGRFIAYEVAPLLDQGETSRVLVMPLGGGEARQVYESAPSATLYDSMYGRSTLNDWTADGRYIVIADAPKGKTGLYLLPVHDGATVGAPIFLCYAEIRQVYATMGGALVYLSDRAGDGAKMFVTRLNAGGRIGTWQSFHGQGGISMINAWPSFSDDSRHVLYVARDSDVAGGARLVSHYLSNGNERILYRSGRSLGCQSDPHSPIVYCLERKDAGRTDLVSVSLQSGDVQFVQSFRDPRSVYRAFPVFTAKALYFTKVDETADDPICCGGSLVKWDLATHQETTIVGVSELNGVFSGIPSADECCVIGANEKELYVKSMSGGDWKPLVHANAGGCFTSTPDGKFVIYQGADTAQRQSFFQVPIQGGEPQRIGDAPAQEPCQGLWVSPDGSQLLAVKNEMSKGDFWLLESFVPPAKREPSSK